jgi:hypothetical protein
MDTRKSVSKCHSGLGGISRTSPELARAEIPPLRQNSCRFNLIVNLGAQRKNDGQTLGSI